MKTVFLINQKELESWVPVAHAYNPSYSGGTDQEDQGLKPAQANSSRDPISNQHKNRAGGMAQAVRVPA
jgi:hypothetical protein